MKAEVNKYVQKYIDTMQAKGITPTVDQINEHLAGFMHQENNRPKEEFEGYSSHEMEKILNFTFDSDSPVQFQSLTGGGYHQMPLMRQAKHLLGELREKQVKLTAAGYLPTRLVKELYPLGTGDFLIEQGISKLLKEEDSLSVTLVRLLCEVAGLVKIRKGILSITSNGSKLVKDDAALFKQLFETYCQKFNWAYFDGYEEEEIGKLGFGFSLILLSKYGSTKQEEQFYAQKYFQAFPMLLEGITPVYQTAERYGAHCYSTRTFERFMLHFSLVELSKGKNYTDPKFITKTALFDKLITILPHREFQMPI